MPQTEESDSWSLYIIRCADGRLYTGITTDIERRFTEHKASADGRNNKGAKALRGKAPLSLVYQSVVGNRSAAQKMEYKVKQLSKTQKDQLVNSQQAVADYIAAIF